MKKFTTKKATSLNVNFGKNVIAICAIFIFAVMSLVAGFEGFVSFNNLDVEEVSAINYYFYTYTDGLRSTTGGHVEKDFFPMGSSYSQTTTFNGSQFYALENTGYDFDGYYGSMWTTLYSTSRSWMCDTSDTSIYARFLTEDTSYMVYTRAYTNGAYSANGGTVKAYSSSSNNDAYDSYSYSDGATATITANVKPYFTFNGWYTSGTGGSLVSTSSTYNFTVGANTFRYARFTGSNVADVYARSYTTGGNYDSTGKLGTVKAYSASTNSDGYDVKYNNQMGSSNTVVATAKSDATFDGWYTNATGGSLVSTNSSYTFTLTTAHSFYTSSDDFNAYARFEADEYNIYTRAYTNGSYSSLGGTVKAYSTSSNYDQYDYYTYDAYNDYATVIATPKSGYYFAGWYTSGTGGTLLSTSETYSFYVNYGDHLYARFYTQ